MLVALAFSACRVLRKDELPDLRVNRQVGKKTNHLHQRRRRFLHRQISSRSSSSFSSSCALSLMSSKDTEPLGEEVKSFQHNIQEVKAMQSFSISIIRSREIPKSKADSYDQWLRCKTGVNEEKKSRLRKTDYSSPLWFHGFPTSELRIEDVSHSTRQISPPRTRRVSCQR